MLVCTNTIHTVFLQHVQCNLTLRVHNVETFYILTLVHKGHVEYWETCYGQTNVTGLVKAQQMVQV